MCRSTRYQQHRRHTSPAARRAAHGLDRRAASPARRAHPCVRQSRFVVHVVLKASRKISFNSFSALPTRQAVARCFASARGPACASSSQAGKPVSSGSGSGRCRCSRRRAHQPPAARTKPSFATPDAAQIKSHRYTRRERAYTRCSLRFAPVDHGWPAARLAAEAGEPWTSQPLRVPTGCRAARSLGLLRGRSLRSLLRSPAAFGSLAPRAPSALRLSPHRCGWPCAAGECPASPSPKQPPPTPHRARPAAG